MQMRPDMLVFFPLVVALAYAAVVDMRERKIRNWLTFGLALAGLAQALGATLLPNAVAPLAPVSAGMSLAGFFVGFGLTFVLFAIGGLGGGDVKLLAAIGTWVGPFPVLLIFAIEAILGMCIVIAQAANQGRLSLLFRNSATVAVNVVNVNHLGVDHVSKTGQSCRAVDRPLPYAVPVLFATVLVLVAKANGF